MGSGTATNDRTFQQSAAAPSHISKLSYSAVIKVTKATRTEEATGIDIPTSRMLVWGESSLQGPPLSLQRLVATGPSPPPPALGGSTLWFGSGLLWTIWSRFRPTSGPHRVPPGKGTSAVERLELGTQAGCVLSPILCIVFMNSWSVDLPNVPMHPQVLPPIRGTNGSLGLEAETGGWVCPFLPVLR